MYMYVHCYHDLREMLLRLVSNMARFIKGGGEGGVVFICCGENIEHIPASAFFIGLNSEISEIVRVIHVHVLQNAKSYVRIWRFFLGELHNTQLGHFLRGIQPYTTGYNQLKLHGHKRCL